MPLSPSPSPPPMPSPQLLPTPLLSPPRRPIVQSRPCETTLCSSDDTLGAERRRRTLKRTLSQPSCRCRSPPPTPAIRSPPPPVPPIPPFVLATTHSSARPSIPNPTLPFDLYLDRPREIPFRESQTRDALTCMQFLAVHNSRGQCRV